jgi:hypothetical protein
MRKMIDEILQKQSSWRYCRVRAGEKKPYPADWQNNPLLLDEVDSTNIGLILGPKGNGVCAIDFDGTSAWTWAEEHGINISKLNSVALTSGKTDRCQMEFHVPEEYWDVLKTKKITTGDKEGFEFRWAGGQSVLPPSIHPDTKLPYDWIIDAGNEVSRIPDDVLYAWLEEIAREIPQVLDTSPEVSIDELTDTDIQEVDNALSILKQRRPGLLYDEWRTIAWAVAHHLGRPVAKAMVTKYYPEQKSGEYDALFRTWNKGKSPKIGSLMFMAGIKKQETPVTKYIDLQQKMKEKYGA